jgi:hypothetical protein
MKETKLKWTKKDKNYWRKLKINGKNWNEIKKTENKWKVMKKNEMKLKKLKWNEENEKQWNEMKRTENEWKKLWDQKLSEGKLNTNGIFSTLGSQFEHEYHSGIGWPQTSICPYWRCFWRRLLSDDVFSLFVSKDMLLKKCKRWIIL